jgi:Tfp pilus assembly protein PilW
VFVFFLSVKNCCTSAVECSLNSETQRFALSCLSRDLTGRIFVKFEVKELLNTSIKIQVRLK